MKKRGKKALRWKAKKCLSMFLTLALIMGSIFVEGKESTAAAVIEVEGNDDFAHATGFSPGDTISGVISEMEDGEHDVDDYTFSLHTEGALVLNITSYSPYYSLYIYDKDGKEVWSATDYEYNDEAGYRTDHHEVDLIAGKYFLKVLGYKYYNAWSTGAYQIQTEFIDANSNSIEPNESFDTAQNIRFEQSITGQIAVNDDYDLYRFELLKEGRVNLSFTSYMQYFSLYLYDSSGEKIWDAMNNEYNANVGYIKQLHAIDLAEGVYYIKIDGYKYYENYATGNYTFLLNYEDALSSVNGPVNNFSAAPAINIGKKYRAQIAVNAESDTFKVDLQNLKEITLALKIYMPYMSVYLYNPSGEEIWSSTNNEWNENVEYREFCYPIDIDEEYVYIKINGYKYYENYGTGCYEFGFASGKNENLSVDLLNSTVSSASPALMTPSPALVTPSPALVTPRPAPVTPSPTPSRIPALTASPLVSFAPSVSPSASPTTEPNQSSLHTYVCKVTDVADEFNSLSEIPGFQDLISNNVQFVIGSVDGGTITSGTLQVMDEYDYLVFEDTFSAVSGRYAVMEKELEDGRYKAVFTFNVGNGRNYTQTNIFVVHNEVDDITEDEGATIMLDAGIVRDASNTRIWWCMSDEVLSSDEAYDDVGEWERSSLINEGYLAIFSATSKIDGKYIYYVMETKSDLGEYYYHSRSNVEYAVVLLKDKKNPVISGKSSYTKTLDDLYFDLNMTTDSDGDLAFTSSNEKVIQMIGNTAFIEGVGTTTILVAVEETSTYEEGYKSIKITVKPGKIKGFNAKSYLKRRIYCSWSGGNLGNMCEIQFSNTKGFKKVQKFRLKSNKHSFGCKMDRSKKVWYVRIRSYQKKNGKTYYGKWSAIKKVKVK